MVTRSATAWLRRLSGLLATASVAVAFVRPTWRQFGDLSNSAHGVRFKGMAAVGRARACGTTMDLELGVPYLIVPAPSPCARVANVLDSARRTAGSVSEYTMDPNAELRSMKDVYISGAGKWSAQCCYEGCREKATVASHVRVGRR